MFSELELTALISLNNNTVLLAAVAINLPIKKRIFNI
jgi:hypothetical protein